MRAISILMVAAMVLGLGGAPVAAETGILLLAHGSHHGGHGAKPAASPSPWNGNVEDVVAVLNNHRPTEVAFGMAEPETIQTAIDRLEARGVTEIAAIPLYVSSHSPIIGNFRYILGLQDKPATNTKAQGLKRVTTKASITFSGALDAHPLVSSILLERALDITENASKTTVVVIAHGPNGEEDNARWLEDMKKHATFLRIRGRFQAVEVLTHRNDAPKEVKAVAKAEFRAKVEAAAKNGDVVVVPLLMSAGGIEKDVEKDLEGLKFKFGQPLLPHANLARWVEEQAENLATPAAK